VCHAFHILKGNGVPEGNIITLLFDDVAGDPDNPFPNTLFNKPTGAGEPGVDVYAGCKKSYTGDAVTAANVLAILTGNASAVTGGSGEVLRSGPDDLVFVNFVDHGATGLVAMPVGPYLYADDLNAALATMRAAGMYRRLVFYLEACESGSMFDGLLPADAGVYATTAASPDESSWGTYCPPGDAVNGTSLGTCLGDLYSVSWMEDADAPGHIKESLEDQYNAVRNATTLSHVQQYGELNFTADAIGAYLGNFSAAGRGAPAAAGDDNNINASSHLFSRLLRGEGRAAGAAPAPRRASSAVSSRQATLASLHARAARGSPTAAAALQVELRAAAVFARAFAALPDAPVPGGVPTQWQCYRAGNAAVEAACGRYTDLTLQYARRVAGLCEAAAGDAGAVAAAVTEACAAAV
jgi:legumain